MAALSDGELGLEPLPVEHVRRLLPATPLTGSLEQSGLWRRWTAGDHDGFTVQIFGRQGP